MSGLGNKDDPPVTVNVKRRVRPGCEEEFEDIMSGIVGAAMKFPGNLGVNVFRPTDPDDREYRLIFKFDRASNLRRWQKSEERRTWLMLMEPLEESPPETEVLTGLETWFTLPGRDAIVPPPRYKMAFITWLAVFPVMTLLFAFSEPILLQLPLALRTFFLTAVIVLVMTYVVMPQMTRIFRRWLYPDDLHSAEQHSDNTARRT